MDEECDLGTEYCHVMKLVCDETIICVPFIAIHIGWKLMSLATDNKQYYWMYFKIRMYESFLQSTVVFMLLQIMSL